jgi:NADPH:quinone reductase
MTTIPTTQLQLQSLVTSAGELKLMLAQVPVPEPKEDEILVRVEATPINPSDLGLLLGPADPASMKATGTKDNPAVTGAVPERFLRALSARLDKSMAVGNEGAGTVVKAGAAPEAQALVGRKVALLGGLMYSQYRAVKARDALPLPADATAADGASCFVNPLTALGFVETMKREGHTAIVHAAAASNLGQMLCRICLKDGIPLVNIVRSKEQADILRGIGATYIVDSTSPSFQEDLIKAVSETNATLAFDPIGGGKLASQILSAMETAQSAKATEYSRYGSSVMKQVYIYGALDTGPTELQRNYGLIWSVSGWLLTPFLQKAGPEVAQRLRQRVVSELKTTFASHYTRTISLREALDLETLKAYARRATGEKFLINPNQGM